VAEEVVRGCGKRRGREGRVQLAQAPWAAQLRVVGEQGEGSGSEQQVTGRRVCSPATGFEVAASRKPVLLFLLFLFEIPVEA